MSKIEQQTSTDILWTDAEPTKEDTHLLVYHQAEHGAATALAGRALIGDASPIAKIYSHLQNVNGINFIPAPCWPEYRLYETYNNNGERYFILRIPSLYPVNASTLPNANPMTWLYTYPIVRDIVLSLNKYGARRMTYLTTNLFKYHSDFMEYGEIEHGHVVTYDFVELADEVEKYYGDTAVEVEDDFAIAPNVWIWCDIFASFCSNPPHSSRVVLGSASPSFVDTDTADTMLNYLYSNYGLGFDEEALEEYAYKLTQMNKHRYTSVEDIISGAFREEGEGDYIP